MNYEYLWKTLEALLLDLRSKRLQVSQEVVEDLKAAKTLFSLQQVDPSAPTTEAGCYLDKIEATLLYRAESCLGKEYVDEWLKRIEEARKKGLTTTQRREIKPILGIPKDSHWILIKITDLVSREDLDAMVKHFGLTNKPHEIGSILVHGPPENVKALIKEITKKTRRR